MPFSSSSSLSSEEPDWAWLPPEILFIIISELFMLSDLISFGSVCSNWRSIAKIRLREFKIEPTMSFNRKLPMLLVPAEENGDSTRNLYNILDGEVYDLRLRMPYNNSRCIGSCHGWLVFIEPVSFMITLYNPFLFGNSKGTIHLPPFLPAKETYERVDGGDGGDFYLEYYICKVIFSDNPLSCPNYTVLLIHGEMRRLAFWKSGDSTWTNIDEKNQFYDLMYCHGHFLAVNFWGEVYFCDVDANCSPFLNSVTDPAVGPLAYYNRRYIVESADGDNLLQVVRLVEAYSDRNRVPMFQTLGFLVYELESMDELLEWVPVTSMGDVAVFLGDNYSTCVRASEFPSIMPNSIYFTDDYHDISMMFYKPYQFVGPGEIGVFQIGDASFHNQYRLSPNQRHLPPPIWILPTL